ncbi:hypothetical protein [Periweissella cryptocerci]|uniref:hypothetical protein n=1 Tax=Periweissella cryptocerci TaxID=2506420 RepID=UPI0014054347|nr:hypothetical protein [Periweissella cryptocerci]
MMWKIFFLAPVVFVFASVALFFGLTSSSFESGLWTTLGILAFESLFFIPAWYAVRDAKKAIK